MFELSDTFAPKTAQPIDNRLVVDTLDELNAIDKAFLYDGLETWVTAEQKRYRWSATDNLWEESYDLTTIMSLIGGIVPKGMIMIWSGTVATIPNGWHLCDGTEGTPDLRNRFVVCAGDSYGVGDIGGSNSVTLDASQMPTHSHEATLTSAGSHTHDGTAVVGGAHTHSGTTDKNGKHSHTYQTMQMAELVKAGSNNRLLQFTDTQTSEDGEHSHKFSISSSGNHGHDVKIENSGDHTHTIGIKNTGESLPHENRPPYYSLCYIQKITGEEGGSITPDMISKKIAECLAESKAYTDEKCEKIAEEIAELNSELDTKLDKENPTGSGSLTLGRYPFGDADTYVARFGNGTSATATSNAMALDYNGNATFTGNVTDGSGNVLSKKVTGINLSTASAMSLDDYAALAEKDATTLYLLYEEDAE